MKLKRRAALALTEADNLLSLHNSFLLSTSFPGGSAGKESACNVGDLGSISGFGRSPGEGKGYSLQYSGLENSRDCIVPWVHKSWTQLRDFHFPFTTEFRNEKLTKGINDSINYFSSTVNIDFSDISWDPN